MWQPIASIETLKRRAHIIGLIRAFFLEHQVLEIDVPVLGEYGVTDPYLDAFTLYENNKRYFLQTSPEYFMKRLLAAGSGDIFYLGKAFRKDESGRQHHAEFTMLEWYRLGMNDQQLIDEVYHLIARLQPDINFNKYSYQTLFERFLGVNPHTAAAIDLERIAKSKIDIDFHNQAKSTWLDLLFSHVVEPALNDGLYAVYDYPACQSALAKTDFNNEGHHVAKRFEFFLNGVELANGYWELTDAEEQRKRFLNDNEIRLQLGKAPIPLDEKFQAAIAQGLPNCAGVALGVDRLIMAILALDSIAQQRSF